MRTAVWLRPQPRLALLRPPYSEFETIDTSWRPSELPPRGYAVVWWLVDATRQQPEFEWLYERPPGLPLVVLLPGANEIRRTLPILGYLSALDPRAILPAGRVAVAGRIRELLAMPPRQLGEAVSIYLSRRGLLPSDDVRREVRKILELAAEVKSISRLALRLHSSRRTLGRHFESSGLPVPSHWLQFGRLVHVAVRLQNESGAAFRIASRYGYPDGFTMSNQMKRLIGARPTEVRRCAGWEWVVECWICQEARRGAIDAQRYGEAIKMYLPAERAPATRRRVMSRATRPKRSPGRRKRTEGASSSRESQGE